MSAFVSVAFCYQGNRLTCETISTQTEVPYFEWVKHAVCIRITDLLSTAIHLSAIKSVTTVI